MNKKLDHEKITPKRPKNRYCQSGYKVSANGVFNCKNIPIGYNWVLGYSEQVKN